MSQHDRAEMVVVLARIEAATRAVMIAEREYKAAKAIFDLKGEILKAAKDARADATTALFDLIAEEIEHEPTR